MLYTYEVHVKLGMSRKSVHKEIDIETFGLVSLTHFSQSNPKKDDLQTVYPDQVLQHVASNQGLPLMPLSQYYYCINYGNYYKT